MYVYNEILELTVFLAHKYFMNVNNSLASFGALNI